MYLKFPFKFDAIYVETQLETVLVPLLYIVSPFNFAVF